MRRDTHIYFYGLLLLCLAGCAKDKAEPSLSDAEKQLLGAWHLNRTEKTMYVPSLGPDVLGDYHNWHNPGYDIEFRENREMWTGSFTPVAGLEYFSYWQLQGTQLKGIYDNGSEISYVLEQNGDSLHITESHSPDYNRHFYLARKLKKTFFPAIFTAFLGNWHVYEINEYALNGQLLNSYTFPGPQSSFMNFSNEWYQQQGYKYSANCYRCPAGNTWKPLLVADKLFMRGVTEYYDIQLTDSTHMEMSFPSLHFPLAGSHPGKTWLFKMTKQ